jgi:Uma2 family endonuclease
MTRDAIVAHATETCAEEREQMAMPASAMRAWTLEELHRLPDDGNKYELVFGELFVTPAPNEQHETIGARLNRLLAPFVADHGLGAVYRPRAVVRYEASEVEPDLMVRKERTRREGSWIGAPTPCLVVEIVSGTTRRRDHIQKRRLYLEVGVPEYWIVDGLERTVKVIRGAIESVEKDVLKWQPAGVDAELTIHLDEVFRDVPEIEE